MPRATESARIALFVVVVPYETANVRPVLVVTARGVVGATDRILDRFETVSRARSGLSVVVLPAMASAVAAVLLLIMLATRMVAFGAGPDRQMFVVTLMAKPAFAYGVVGVGE